MNIFSEQKNEMEGVVYFDFCMSYIQTQTSNLINLKDMQNFLFFNYARLKGYKFDLTTNDKPSGGTTFLSSQSGNDERLIFASYKGKIVGAVQISAAIMPDKLLEGPEKKDNTSQQSLVISYFFINTEEGLRRDIVTAGLLLKLQSYAKDTNKQFCVGYSYDSFCKELRNTSMTFFNVNYNQIFKCSPGLEASLKDKVDKHLRLEKPFIWNTRNALLTLSMSKKGTMTALSNAA